MTSMMVTKEYLTNLKRISKIFDNGMMFDSFAVVDKTHVSMLCVDTVNHFDKKLLLFSEIPNFFISKFHTLYALQMLFESLKHFNKQRAFQLN